MIDKLIMYLAFPFVRNALIVGVLISLCASLLGVTLVLRRFSFIGDGLSHVAFGTMAVATVIGLTNDMLLILPVTVLAAIIILKGGEKRIMKGDAMIAVASVSSLAFGYLIMNMFSSAANVSGDVCTTLFGSTSILTLDTFDVVLSSLLSAFVLLVFILYFNRLYAVTFDEEFCKATGVDPERMNLVIAVLTAIVIVLGMKLVGSLLITALVIFPALSAMRLFGSFKSVTIVSALISVIGALLGIVFSILVGTPVGSTIVAVDFTIFVIFHLLGRFIKVER